MTTPQSNTVAILVIIIFFALFFSTPAYMACEEKIAKKIAAFIWWASVIGAIILGVMYHPILDLFKR